jgi:hydroxymethylpyrimidine pyrophosphatase-like HAD family hydrolase
MPKLRPAAVWPGIPGTRTDFANLPSELYIQLCEGALGLIMNRSASKHEAMNSICPHCNISCENVVAFGDDLNDVGMLRAYP